MEDRLFACESAAAKGAHGLAFEDWLDGVGVKPECQCGVVFEGLAMETGKVGLRAPAGEVRFEVFEGWGGLVYFTPDGFVVSGDSGQTFKLEGTFVVAGELCFREGPAAGFDGGACLEVEGVKLEDLTAPFGSGAALGTEASCVDAVVGKAGHLTFVGFLRRLLDLGATCLEHENSLAPTYEFDCEEDAGCSCSNLMQMSAGEAVSGVEWRRS